MLKLEGGQFEGVMNAVYCGPFVPHCCRVLLLIGVDVPNQEEKQEPALTGEEDHFEDENDNDPLLK